MKKYLTRSSHLVIPGSHRIAVGISAMRRSHVCLQIEADAKRMLTSLVFPLDTKTGKRVYHKIYLRTINETVAQLRLVALEHMEASEQDRRRID